MTEIENVQVEIPVPVEVATAASVPDHVPAPRTVVEVVHVTRNTRFQGKSKEEAAAIRIQTAFRGYLVCVFLTLNF